MCLKYVKAGKDLDLIIFRWVRHRQPHNSRRYNRRNGVLINHLANRIFQQHYKLVERLNLALQFNTIHQIDGYRHSFLTQNI